MLRIPSLNDSGQPQDEGGVDAQNDQGCQPNLVSGCPSLRSCPSSPPLYCEGFVHPNSGFHHKSNHTSEAPEWSNARQPPKITENNTPNGKANARKTSTISNRFSRMKTMNAKKSNKRLICVGKIAHKTHKAHKASQS